MDLDASTAVNILKVNSLSLQSPRDQIQSLLLKAGYSEDEINQVLGGNGSISPVMPATAAQSVPPASIPDAVLQGSSSPSVIPALPTRISLGFDPWALIMYGFGLLFCGYIAYLGGLAAEQLVNNTLHTPENIALIMLIVGVCFFAGALFCLSKLLAWVTLDLNRQYLIFPVSMLGIYNRQEKVALSSLTSLAVCRTTQLDQYLDKYTDPNVRSTIQKRIDRANRQRNTYIGGRYSIIGNTAGRELANAARPSNLMLIQTQDNFWMSDLSSFNDKAPYKLIEIARNGGVNVLNSLEEDASVLAPNPPFNVGNAMKVILYIIVISIALILFNRVLHLL